MSYLPGVLGEIADITDEPTALLIADQLGGSDVRIPRRVEDADWLIDIVGRGAAVKICDHFLVADADGILIGSRRLTIPRGPAGLMRRARRRAMEAIAAGQTTREAARASGLHERTVWRLKARLRQRHTSRQHDLFLDP